jgi:uncharacterized protein
MLFIEELYPLVTKGLEAIFMHNTTPSRQHPPTLAARLPRWLALVLGTTLLTLTSHTAQAATPAASTPASPTVMRTYSAAQVMQGLYGQHLPPLSQRFMAEADALVLATQQHCEVLPSLGAGYQPQLSAWTHLHTQWQSTMTAWEALSTPAVGPVLTRRSQRQIDFWPTRYELIQKALDKAPQSLADMETVGTLAKGLPAFEALLTRPLDPAHGRSADTRGPKSGTKPQAQPQANTPMSAATCHYLTLLALGIQAEGRELGAELAVWANKDWLASTVSDPEATRTAYAEWLNQWLGGVERLRWMHLEKPIKTEQTQGKQRKGNTPSYARLGREANLAGWRAQWHSLLAQARLTEAQRITPPTPGQAVIPIEALLLGEGQTALAQRWAQALDAVTVRIDQLPAQASSGAAEQRELLALTAALKAVTVLFQNEVSSALDFSLGFSDADGD